MIFTSEKVVASNTVSRQSMGAAGTLVVSSSVNSARKLLKAFGYINVAGQFIQLHNLAAAPVLGNIPLMTLASSTGAGQNWMFDFSSDLINGLDLSVGITIASSSTAPTFTASAAPTLSGLIIYI
jgi:hypothetical protein